VRQRAGAQAAAKTASRRGRRQGRRGRPRARLEGVHALSQSAQIRLVAGADLARAADLGEDDRDQRAEDEDEENGHAETIGQNPRVVERRPRAVGMCR
jgi:hypothetical protein